MLAGCLVPIAAIIAIGVFGLSSSALLTLALVVLCPLMMLFMMGGHDQASAPRDHRPATPDERSSAR
jgi:hypothetical protein